MIVYLLSNRIIEAMQQLFFIFFLVFVCGTNGIITNIESIWKQCTNAMWLLLTFICIVLKVWNKHQSVHQNFCMEDQEQWHHRHGKNITTIKKNKTNIQKSRQKKPTTDILFWIPQHKNLHPNKMKNLKIQRNKPEANESSFNKIELSNKYFIRLLFSTIPSVAQLHYHGLEASQRYSITTIDILNAPATFYPC